MWKRLIDYVVEVNAMEETIKLEITPTEAKHFEGLLDWLSKEMDASLVRMNQYEAERLKAQAETEALLTQIKGMLHVEATH